MLGRRVLECAISAGYHVDAPSETELDIRDEIRCVEVLGRLTPEIVINCAGYTNVDAAETNRDAAFAINAAGAGNVARAAVAIGAGCLYVSTDYVFDGGKPEPYTESDTPHPINYYGETKAEGERQVIDALKDKALIVRTSWLFGEGGPNFPQRILELALTRSQLDVVADQIGSPSYSNDVAAGMLELCRAGASGIVHLTNTGYTSWCEFAREILSTANIESVEIRPVATSSYPRPARRPLNSRMAQTRLAQFGVAQLPHWRDGLGRFMQSIGLPKND